MLSTKQCVICEEDQGENAKLRKHFGCKNSCDACRKFFESSVKEMAKSSHVFLGGKNADRHCSNNLSEPSKCETPQDSSIKCVICEAPKEEVKIGNHYGCNSSCITCRKFFESSVKNMTKSSHTFLGGKKADRHCYNNFGCHVKGKRPCTSCRFLKCIDNRMNPELPLKNAAREVQFNDPEGDNKALDVYINDLRPIYESNLNKLLSAADEARGNSKIEPAMISGPTNNCEEFYGKVYSDVTSHYSHLPLSELPPPGTYGNVAMEHGNYSSNVSYPHQSNYSCFEHMPYSEGIYNWNRDSYNNGCTDFAIPNDSFPVSCASLHSRNTLSELPPAPVQGEPRANDILEEYSKTSASAKNKTKSNPESDENDEENIIEDSENEEESSSDDPESEENNEETSKKTNVSNQDSWFSLEAKKFILQRICSTDAAYAEFCPGSCSTRDKIRIKKKKFRKLTLDVMRKFPAQMSSEEYNRLDDSTTEQKEQKKEILKTNIRKIETNFKHLKMIANNHSSHVSKREFKRKSRIEKIFLEDHDFESLIDRLYLCMNPQKKKEDGLQQNNSALLSQKIKKIETEGTSIAGHASTSSSIDPLKVLSPVHEFGAPSTSGINNCLFNNTILVQNLISQLVDVIYALSCSKIGTIIAYHLLEKPTDWTLTKKVFITPPDPYNQPYQRDLFGKIFTNKATLHDGALILNLCNGRIDSVSAKPFMRKHDCESKCASRGTRHSSACSFSNFTTVPIIVISEENGQVSLFWKGGAQYEIDKDHLKKELLKAYETQEVLSPVHEVGASSTSGTNIHLFNNTIFVQNLIAQLVDEIYVLSCKKIGCTVIAYHLFEETANWKLTKSMFITSSNPYNQPYQPSDFKKFFTSKGPEHDGVVILNLSNGLIDSVSVKLYTMKHDCESKCASRGTRHSSACSFSNFTTVPIIVISEENGQVSLFWKGGAQYEIDKDHLKKELLKAYETQEATDPSCFSQQCVICGDQGANAKIRNYYGCECCDTCRKFFESSVKEMTKSSHTFLAGEKADRHCCNNFSCEVKGKRPCTSCRFLKCIDNQMNPELPLTNAAIEMQKNDPEGGNKPLDDYIKDLRPIFESNLNGVLSAAHEARANSKIEPAMSSRPKNNCEESAGTVYSDTDSMSSAKQCVICEDQEENVKIGTHFGKFNLCKNSCNACRHFFKSSVKNMTKSSHVFLGGKNADRHCYNNFGCEVKGKRSCTSCRFLKCINNRMNPEMPLRSAAREVQKNDPEDDTLGPVAQSIAPLGSQITGTSNQQVECYGFEQSTPVPVVQNVTYYAPIQSVNHAGPSTHVHAGAYEMLERNVQNLQLDPSVPNDSEMKDTPRERCVKRKNPAEKVNEKAKRSISAEPFNRLAIKQYTDELCRILNSFGMKMDTGFECDYGNNAQDRRCDCGRSLGQPYTDPVTRKKTLRNTMIDGPHHFSNWMFHQGLHPDIYALANPKEVLSRKSICPAGRFYQSRDVKEYFEAESKKDDGKYKELKKNELRSDHKYFICCKRKDQQYWQIYYGTDEHCKAGYGPYQDFDERRYFLNKEFHR